MAHSVTAARARNRHPHGARRGAGADSFDGAREMLWIVGIGLTAGIAVALSVTRFAESQLYGVKPRDAVVVGGGRPALAATAFASGYLPARRAAKVNPLHALHYE